MTVPKQGSQWSLSLCRLERCLYTVPREGPVECCLWRMTPQAPSPLADSSVYAIGMAYVGEEDASSGRRARVGQRLYCVGQEEAAARRLFDRMKRGRLSPVHLEDVVRDHLWEDEQDGNEE